MKSSPVLFLIATLLYTACQDQSAKKQQESLVDKEKIDAVFGKDVSQVLFNHLYVVVDSITYAKLIHNSQLKNTYANLDSGLPDFTSVKSSSTTCYLRGYKHYIEVLGPANSYKEPVGKSGIGFSLKNGNEHFHLGITPKMKAEEATWLKATETVFMPFAQAKQTWFKAFYTPTGKTALHTWYGFYNPVFLDSLFGGQHTSYSREVFLRTVYDDQKLFNGITEITMRCIPEDYNRIVQEMRYLGCALLNKNGKELTIASGDISLRIAPSDTLKYSQITKIKCRLNEEEHSETQLGNLTITNRGMESVWNFNELHKNNSLK